MGRPLRWRCSPARALSLACLAPAAVVGLRTLRTDRGQRSLICDISDTAANTGVDLAVGRQEPEKPALCQEDLLQQWRSAATNCAIHEGPYWFQEETKKYWNSHACPLTSEGLQRASSPLHHSGARLRLRRAVKRLLDGHQLNVTVLGGSMTIGHQSIRSWSERLQDLFRTLQLPVAVINRAQGGTTSRWVLANWKLLLEDFKRSDVILIDYGINDQGKNFDFRTVDGLGDQVVTGIYKDMVKMLLSLPHKPAILDIETFRSVNVMTMARLDESASLEMECQDFQLASYRHWQANKDLDLPTISYPEAVCGSGRTFWMHEGKKDADENELQHPGALTHDLFARVVRGVLLQEMDEVCASGVHGSDHPSDLADKVGNHIQCLARPLTYLSAERGAEHFRPTSDIGGRWRFGEDVPGKPGWLAEGGFVGDTKLAVERDGEISFDVWTQEGWVQVEFLGTYENIGFVSVWLDDEEPRDDNSCHLDGFWLEHSSQSRFSLMKTKLAPGAHSLKIRAYGMKFKLLGIATC